MSLPVSGSCTETIAPFLLAIVLWMKFDIVEREHKELREEIFAQVACHISVTFTSQNNSRLPLLSLHPLPPLCVFPTLCEWTVKETYSKKQCVCVCSVKEVECEHYFLCLDGLFVLKWWGSLSLYLCYTLDWTWHKVKEHARFTQVLWRETETMELTGLSDKTWHNV